MTFCFRFKGLRPAATGKVWQYVPVGHIVPTAGKQRMLNAKFSAHVPLFTPPGSLAYGTVPVIFKWVLHLKEHNLENSLQVSLIPVVILNPIRMTVHVSHHGRIQRFALGSHGVC